MHFRNVSRIFNGFCEGVSKNPLKFPKMLPPINRNPLGAYVTRLRPYEIPENASVRLLKSAENQLKLIEIPPKSQ